MVGIAQLVSASDCGSEGRGFESHYPPSKRRLFTPLFYLIGNSALCGAKFGEAKLGSARFSVALFIRNGLSPSGKAQDFDSCIRGFESR